jgi:uncharacterized protein (TIGR02145 family)
MKKYMHLPGVLFILTVIIPAKNILAQSSVKIPAIIPVQQEWMINNLDVSHFRNGNPVPEAVTDSAWNAAGNNKQPAWCYFHFDSLKYQAIYGKLYNWYAVNDPRGLAPAGWHIPADSDWNNLIMLNLGGFNTAGDKMKLPVSLWKNGMDSLATNSSGFAAIPSGGRTNGSTFSFPFSSPGIDACWWSATQSTGDNAFCYYLSYYSPTVFRYSDYKGFGFSVRCIKN